MKWTFFKILKTIWVSGGILFTLWLVYSAQSQGVDVSFLEESSGITVQDTDRFYAFTPRSESDKVFIFYPGAMVEPKAYVPLCRKIAEENIKVYLIKMPWRLATTRIHASNRIKLATKSYILSGHSQGGKMAGQFVFENPDLVDKLILIGTTHPRDVSLATNKVKVLKIYGSNDGVADKKSVVKNKDKLPGNAIFWEIIGGNHSQFGYYGYQLGDDKAGISREQQQAETLTAILDFIKK